MNAPRSTATLARAMKYENQQVVRRYCDTFGVPFEEGARLFEDLKKWLWVCFWIPECQKAAPGDPSLPKKAFILSSQWRLDEMWHCFILFTREYTTYCDTCFGRYIHHEPEAPPQAQEKVPLDDELMKLMGFIYDHLGPELVERWYGHFDVD